jgi:hypothetical protein
VPARYALVEHVSPDYAARTEANVADADATLILARGALSGGTALTRDVARRLQKPFLIVDLGASPAPRVVREWLAGHAVGVLNVAGPRESQRPGIGEEARAFLREVLAG